MSGIPVALQPQALQLPPENYMKGPVGSMNVMVASAEWQLY